MKSGSVSHSVVSDSVSHELYSLPGSSIHGILQAQILENCHFLLQGTFPTQGSNPGFPALQAVSLPSEPPGKP